MTGAPADPRGAAAVETLSPSFRGCRHSPAPVLCSRSSSRTTQQRRGSRPVNSSGPVRRLRGEDGTQGKCWEGPSSTLLAARRYPSAPLARSRACGKSAAAASPPPNDHLAHSAPSLPHGGRENRASCMPGRPERSHCVARQQHPRSPSLHSKDWLAWLSRAFTRSQYEANPPSTSGPRRKSPSRVDLPSFAGQAGACKSRRALCRAIHARVVHAKEKRDIKATPGLRRRRATAADFRPDARSTSHPRSCESEELLEVARYVTDAGQEDWNALARV